MVYQFDEDELKALARYDLASSIVSWVKSHEPVLLMEELGKRFNENLHHQSGELERMLSVGFGPVEGDNVLKRANNLYWKAMRDLSGDFGVHLDYDEDLYSAYLHFQETLKEPRELYDKFLKLTRVEDSLNFLRRAGPILPEENDSEDIDNQK